MDIRERLILLSILKKGNWMEMYKVLNQDPQLRELRDQTKLMRQLEGHDIQIVTIIDEDYPICFKKMEQPPFVLFYQGDLSLLDCPKIGIMGTTRPSSYGMRSCQSLINQLVKHEIVIVGGLQLGIDSIAQLISTQKGRTVAILASGFYRIYPTENYALYRRIAKDHLVISEYPPHVPIESSQFYMRNRLIAAISDVLMVIEMGKSTGMLNSAKRALYDGKLIYALPGEYNSIHSEGSLELIKEGAKCLTNSQEVMEELALLCE